MTLSQSGSTISVVSVQPAAGWTYTVDKSTGGEIEIQFKKGSKEIHFKAALLGGVIKVTLESGA